MLSVHFAIGTRGFCVGSRLKARAPPHRSSRATFCYARHSRSVFLLSLSNTRTAQQRPARLPIARPAKSSALSHLSPLGASRPPWYSLRRQYASFDGNHGARRAAAAALKNKGKARARHALDALSFCLFFARDRQTTAWAAFTAPAPSCTRRAPPETRTLLAGCVAFGGGAMCVCEGQMPSSRQAPLTRSTHTYTTDTRPQPVGQHLLHLCRPLFAAARRGRCVFLCRMGVPVCALG